SDRIQIGDYLIEIKADAAEQQSPTADDQLTQPIEKPERAPSSLTNIPEMQLGGPNAETVKLPATLQATAEPGGNGVAAAAAATPAPVLEPKPALPPAPAPAPAPALEPKSKPAPEPAADTSLARLTVLSSNFAGVEYELNDATMVLGRTDDNDIVINHRSI